MTLFSSRIRARDSESYRPLFLIQALVTCLIFTSAVAAPHKLRISDPGLAESLARRGARLVADYGSYQIMESDNVPAGISGDARLQFVDRFNLIQLNAKSLNTRTPRLGSSRESYGSFKGRRMHLIQFKGPIKPEWHQALERTGVRILSYLPCNAYLVDGNDLALARCQSWAGADPFVQWDGPYLDDYKIHPKARVSNDKGASQAAGAGLFAIQLAIDDEANADTLATIDKLKLGALLGDSRVLNYRNLIVPLASAALPEIAVRPDVVSIQPYAPPRKRDERADQIIAGNLAGDVPSGPGYLSWLAGKGFNEAQFEASGFVVDVSDSGIDNGTIVPGHFGLYHLGVPAQGTRVAYVRLAGTPNLPSTTSGCDGHGALNAHIIAGYNAFDGFPFADSEGYSYGLGVCPFVKVGSSVIFDPEFTHPDYPTLMTQAYNNNARISNGSWGAPDPPAYDVDAQTYDALVRDAGASAQGRQMVIVFAAGNEGPTAQTIESPGTAKNVITVGAAENVFGSPNTSADSANDMTDFSSRGPCLDGRMKPDLVAPGTFVTGGVPQVSTSTNGTGLAIACYDGSGVAELFYPSSPSQQFYTVSSGTSHATPAVSGACALLRQNFINHSLTPPSPAMTKAYLMNSARYLTGVHANDTLWSSSQGMGELDLGTAFDGVPRILLDQVAADVFSASGQTRSFTGYVADPSKSVRVTVAWTDAPGSTTASQALVNDLDLTVTINGATCRGNVFNGPWSVTGGSADSLNNVESVFLPAGQTNYFTVSITAANIAADALTNGGSFPQQDFALVVYNATLVPTPAISVSSYSIVQESCAPANGAIDSGETVTLNVSLRNLGAADSTNLAVTLRETPGIMAPSGPQTYGALSIGGPSVTQPFTFTATGQCGGTNLATFAVQDGTLDLGLVTVPLRLGTPATIYRQYFDAGGSAGLPLGWTSSATGAQKPWSRSKGGADTVPYSALSRVANGAGVNALVSPPIQLPGIGSQLIFRNRYDLEAGGTETAFDGGVLDIKIGSGSFVDILEAGGSFVTGGYNRTIDNSYGNPLAERKAWSGDSDGFITTVVNLPPTAAGQTMQLRWRCASDRANVTAGWHIDTLAINSYWCCPDPAPLPVFTPISAVYAGLFYDPNDVQVRSSGAYSLKTTAGGTYSGTLQMGKSRLRFSGRFDPFGVSSNRIASPASGLVLTLLARVDAADNNRIVGTVDGGGWRAQFQANRSAFHARNNPSPYPARSTMIIPGSGDVGFTGVPFGDGYGAISITPAGALRLAGSLADGAKSSQTTKVSQDGSWPVYIPLDSGAGHLLGWLQFTAASSQAELSGWINWIKPPLPSATYYPNGFNVTITNVLSSSYNALASPITGFSSGVLTLTGGGLAANLSDAVAISSNNKATGSPEGGLSLTFNRAQGLFKGKFKDASTLQTYTFSGAILQNRNAGFGYFLGTSHSGKAALAP